VKDSCYIIVILNKPKNTPKKDVFKKIKDFIIQSSLLPSPPKINTIPKAKIIPAVIPSKKKIEPINSPPVAPCFIFSAHN
jgi:hypothetical protein